MISLLNKIGRKLKNIVLKLIVIVIITMEMEIKMVIIKRVL
jgi:hypothetical protein